MIEQLDIVVDFSYFCACKKMKHYSEMKYFSLSTESSTYINGKS